MTTVRTNSDPHFRVAHRAPSQSGFHVQVRDGSVLYGAVTGHRVTSVPFETPATSSIESSLTDCLKVLDAAPVVKAKACVEMSTKLPPNATAALASD